MGQHLETILVGQLHEPKTIIFSLIKLVIVVREGAKEAPTPNKSVNLRKEVLKSTKRLTISTLREKSSR